MWTNAVRKLHDDAAYRARHMVAINIADVMAGGKVIPHARPIAQISAVVAEYAMDDAKAKRVFAWSPFPINPRHAQAQSLIKACEEMRPGKGLMVSLPDPAGIVQELAFLMKRNVDLFNSNSVRRRNMAASTAIAQIEQAVRTKAEMAEIAAAEQVANEQSAANPLGHWLSEDTRRRTEEMRNTTPAEAKRAADNEWKKYAKKFDTAARDQWQKKFNADLEAYDAKYIAPLAVSHVAWMKSGDLANYFECNYDPKNAASGAMYTAVFNQCVFSTQDKAACTQQYDDWFDGDVTDTKNLVLRAMIFNQDTVASAVAKATTVSISWKQIPWDNLFGIYTESIDRLTRSATDASAGFVVAFAGPIARLLGRAIDSKHGVRGAVMALGLISGHPIVKIEFTGGRAKFRALVVKELLKASGGQLSEYQMKVAVGAQLNHLGVHGVKLNGNTNKTFLIMPDKTIAGMPASAITEQQKCNWVVTHLRTVEALDDLNLGRWRTVINKNFRFGIVAGLLQTVSLSKMIADDDKALADSKLDAKLRMFTALATVAATGADVMANAWQGVQSLRMGISHVSSTAHYTKLVAKGFGIAAGLVMAGLDAYQAVEAAGEKQAGMAWLYSGSAVAGAGLTLALAYAGALGALAIPIIGVLILLVIGIGLLIEHYKDNPIQDWLERCAWGILSSQRYQNMDFEQAQLQLALKDD